MVFKPNYNFQKAERLKAKQSRKEEKAREKEQRKAEGGTSPADASTPVDGAVIEQTAEQPGQG